VNKDEATKQWIADHTLGDLKPHDGAIMCFREGYEEGYEAGYEAGQRAERVRIHRRPSGLLKWHAPALEGESR